ncbi:MAG TPA: class I SAM-dependent methyltransferase, partial [Blastocatellia bacterium]
SGLLSAELLDGGYRVLGIDVSAAMIRLARQKAREAKFRVSSAYDAELPQCGAVLAVGEPLNYLSDAETKKAHRRNLLRLFRKIYIALNLGGILIFDMAVPGLVPERETLKFFTEGKDWLIAGSSHEDAATGVLTRRIITFRKSGRGYRRSDEVHRQALYPASEITQELAKLGFSVRVSRQYGRFRLLKSRAAFIARKEE